MSASAPPVAQVESNVNRQAYKFYTRNQFDKCLALIDTTIKQNVTSSKHEYLLYLKGNILCQQGKLTEALDLYQKVAYLNPQNIANLKQIAQVLYLLGRTKACLDMCTDIDKMSVLAQEEHSSNTSQSASTGSFSLANSDIDIEYIRGLCCVSANNIDGAIQAFKTCIRLRPSPNSYLVRYICSY